MCVADLVLCQYLNIGSRTKPMMVSTKEGGAMLKKYIVRLTDAEREGLNQIVAKFKGTSQKVRRAQVLLKADASPGKPAWTDARIADAFGCRTKTVENIRERFVTKGFEVTLEGQRRDKPPRAKLLDGEQEAKVIACVWARHRRGLRTGRCGCWPSRWWRWRSSNRSATRRCVAP